MRQHEALLDAIDLAYQASLEPALWPKALRAVTHGLQASRALILYRHRDDGAMLTSHADEPLVDSYFADFKVINPIQQALDSRWSKRRPPAFTDQDLVANSDLVRSEFYAGFMLPADMHSILMAPIGESYAATVNVFRSSRAQEFGRGEVELATRMQRSFSSAWSMSQRLQAERGAHEALVDFIDRLPSAVLLVAADGRVAHANASAQAILASRDGLFAPAGILEAHASPARARLRQLVSLAASRDAERRGGGAMTVSRPSGSRPFVVQVAPARGEAALSARDAPLAVVCVNDPESSPPVPIVCLREVFGLSAAEARLAQALFEGSSVHEAAEAIGVSVVTVRNQLARIFEKTGVNRQAALIGLILRSMFSTLK